jgi:hypothetical protein
MNLRRKKAVHVPEQMINPIEVVSAQSLIYNAAVTALLSPDISWLSNIWQLVDVYLTEASTTSSREGSDLPLLGISSYHCRLILDISYLARCTPLQSDDEIRSIRVREELDSWLNDGIERKEIVADASSCSQKDQRANADRLYAIAAHILLLKTMQPNLSAEHPCVQDRVQQALWILRDDDVQGFYWNQHYCWPFVILCCAVLHEADVIYLHKRSEILWQRSRWGDAKRTISVLENISRRRTIQGQFSSLMMDLDSCEVSSAFDLLLRKDGLSTFVKE